MICMYQRGRARRQDGLPHEATAQHVRPGGGGRRARVALPLAARHPAEGGGERHVDGVTLLLGTQRVDEHKAAPLLM
jgi:hypothetical protein